MSVCTFIASDCPLPAVNPDREYPIEINVDTGEICDGGGDDNFILLPFGEADVYSSKKYGVTLEWRYTPGRAAKLIDYIAAALRETETVELWRVWLGDWYWYEYEERPVHHLREIRLSELVPEDIEELDGAEIWNNKEKNRPSFYRLVISR